MTALLRDGFHWLLSLLEAMVAIGAVLIVGLLCAVVPLWVLGRMGPRAAVLDDDVDETDAGSIDTPGEVRPDDVTR